MSVTKKDYTAQLLADLQRRQLGFVAAGGEAIRREAVKRCPVDTGNLRSSIRTYAFVDDGVAVSETGPEADYAEYVEFGTSRQRAQPYMEPGYQAAIPDIARLAEIFRL